VLPALGELTVRQGTVDDLVAHVEVRGEDDAAAALVKGDARMAQVLRRAVYAQVRMPAEPLVVVRGSRRWRVPAYELEEMVRELLGRDIRYGAARDALPQRIAHAVLVQMERSGEAPDDRVQDAVARSSAVKAVVKEAWPVVDPAKLVLRLLTDAEFLAEHADGVLSGQEQKTILAAKPARSVKAARWSAADAVLIDEAKDLVERTHSLGHVVLDEAQDLSPMQYRAVGRRCTTGSATVLGDLAQGTTPWATRSWEEALGHLGKADAVVEELTAGFRVPTDVIVYASRLLPHIAPGLTPVASVRENPGFFDLREVADPADVVAACQEMLRNEGSTGLIAADARIPALTGALAAAGVPWLSPGEETTAETRLTLVPASLAKGLEYDYVVLDEPQAVVDGEPDERTGLRRLYVTLTRAVSGLLVTHTAPLPHQLT
jgi:DNA helicase IV